MTPPDGHAERFERCFERNYRDVARYCARRAATPEDAEDATTEVFATAWRRRVRPPERAGRPAVAVRHRPARACERRTRGTAALAAEAAASGAARAGAGGAAVRGRRGGGGRPRARRAVAVRPRAAA